MSTVLLIKTLCEDYGYDEQELVKLNKTQLEDMINMEKNEAVEITEQDDLVPMPVEESTEVPTMTSPHWNDYVLSKFTPEELFDGNPTVDGLRRVAELLIGPVVESKTKVVQAPGNDNEGRATVVATVTFLKKIEDYEGPVTYSGAADAYHGNIQPGFERYPVALAETRAEGRAYRKALRLRNIAAEEAGVDMTPKTTDNSAIVSPLNSAQQTMIKMLAKGKNINVEKLLKSLDELGSISYNDSKYLSENDGRVVIQALNAINNGSVVPKPEILGYVEDWRK